MSVVNFPSEEEMMFLCDCGCSSFEILIDGTAICVGCEERHDNDMVKAKRRVDEVQVTEEKHRTIEASNGDLAYRRVLKAAQTGTPMAVVVLDADGAATSWYEKPETDAQREWFKELFAEIVTSITR